MKDEEMAEKYAEEYVMREDVITENDRIPFDNGYGWQTISFENEVKKGYKDGFLAGLKAGRPQWHDLRKDPNDLPKDDMCEVVIITPSGEWEKGIFRRLNCKCYWRIIGFNENVKVIAWCEIPTFDKE